MCPPGVGETSSTTIGVGGGTASLLGQQGKASGVAFSIDIPPTALAADTVINAGFNQGSLMRLPQYILNGYPKTAAQLGCP